MLGLVLAVNGASAQESLLLQLSRNERWLHFGMTTAASRSAVRTWEGWKRPAAASGKETLAIQEENNQSKLNYELTSDTERFTVNATASVDNVVIHREPKGKSDFVPVEFIQSPKDKSC